MSRLCLDTSAYSHFARGEPEAVDAIRGARIVGVPVIVLGELRAGFRLGRNVERNERELQAFLAHPVVRVLEVDDTAASLYAQIVAVLREAGTPIPTNDLWIAALAAREGATVLTYDRHFERIGRIGARVLRRPPVRG